MSNDDLQVNIKGWLRDRKITVNGSSQAQLVKLGEEFGELCAGIARGDKKLIEDSIGDMFVVMMAISTIEGLNMNECIRTAWHEIEHRKGYLNESGIFIKEEEQ